VHCEFLTFLQNEQLKVYGLAGPARPILFNKIFCSAGYLRVAQLMQGSNRGVAVNMFTVNSIEMSVAVSYQQPVESAS